jgi:hypothetical protein
MHELCRAEIPGSRMCTSSDLVRNGASDAITSDLGALLPSGGWVHPAAVVEVMSDATGTNINTGIWLDSVSGARSSGDSRGMLSCYAWTTTGTQVRGLTIIPTGSLQEGTCGTARPVACCAEVKKIK